MQIRPSSNSPVDPTQGRATPTLGKVEQKTSEAGKRALEGAVGPATQRPPIKTGKIHKTLRAKTFGPRQERAGAAKEIVDLKTGEVCTASVRQGLVKSLASYDTRALKMRASKLNLKKNSTEEGLSDIEAAKLASINARREHIIELEQQLEEIENPAERARVNIASLREKCGGTPLLVKGSSGEELQGMRFGSDKNTPFDPNKKTVLLFLGSGDRAENYAAPIVPELQNLGLQVAFVNPPGFGESETEPDAQSYLDTADSLYGTLKAEGAKDENLCVMGYSLGGAAAAELASKHPLPMVGDRTYSSIEGVAKAEVTRMTESVVKLPGVRQLTGKVAGGLTMRAAKKSLGLDVEGKLPSIKKRALFFNGDKEKRGPEAVNIPGVEGYTFEGGHFHNDDAVWFSGLAGEPEEMEPAQRALRSFFEDFKAGSL